MDSSTRENLLKSFDLIVIGVVFVISALASQPEAIINSLDEFFAMRLKIENFAIFGGLLISWHIIFSLFGLYTSKRIGTKLSEECFDVLKAISVGTLIIMGIAFMFQIQIVNPAFLTLFWIAASASMIISRIALMYIQKLIRLSGRNLKYAVMVGTNQRAIEIARKIESREDLGYRFVGFVDDHWHLADMPGGNDSIVSNLGDFNNYLKDHVVDEVFICAPVKSFYEKVSRIISQCEEQGITVRLMYDLYTPSLSKVYVDGLAEHQVMTMTVTKKRTYSLFIKWLIDVSAASTILIVFAPFLLTAAVFIKATSPGPILFVQERVGRNKRKFKMYKFRTMVVDAESKHGDLEHLNEASGPVFKIQDDPRITSVGRFLRNTSFDELPQLFNVLKGDMSLVGPRPLPVRDYEGFNHHYHCRRLSVQPGLTGLWQVNGRSSISFDKWMELDLEYIDKWSLWLDIKILFKTIPAVLKGDGAS